MGKASRRKKQRISTGKLDLQEHPDKISTRLGKLVSPHMTDDETRDSFDALVALGAMAWNLSLLHGDERSEAVRQAVQSAVKAGLPLTVQWLNDLIERKLLLFPSDDRFIGKWEVRDEQNGRFTLIVAGYA